MPQLQIKVPTISRWGKKMAVVVDKSFWQSMSPMNPVKHLSNSDIVWFIMDYRPHHDKLDVYVDSNSHFGKCTCTFQNENASNS